MLRALDKYNEDHAVSFAGYYQRCLKNLAVECLRREHRQRVVPHNLLIHGDKGELALMSASVESCEKQVFYMRMRRNTSITYLALKEKCF